MTQSIIFRVTAIMIYMTVQRPPKTVHYHFKGEVEIEVSTGEKRIFRGGDVPLVEDTEGQGHKSRAISGKRESIFVTL